MTTSFGGLITDANKYKFDATYTVELPSGKKIRMVPDLFHPNFFVLEFTSGGELPKELQGKFSDEREARNAIQNWMQRKYK